MTYPEEKINQHCCSAGCFGSFRWKGMSPNGGCQCLQDMNPSDRIQVRNIIKEYQNRILKLEDKINDMSWELNPDRMGQ